MTSRAGSIYGTAKWKAIRKTVLAEEPTCHWCKRAPSTQADHLVEIARGGDPYERSNLVGSCAKCNAKRGSLLGNKRAEALRRQNRGQSGQRSESAVFGSGTTPTPPPPQTNLAGRGLIEADGDRSDVGGYVPGQIPPRLVTARYGDKSYGPAVVAWAAENMKVQLYPWQVEYLDGALEHDDDGQLLHRWSLGSTARQQGKTVMMSALVGWWLTAGRLVRGGPQQVLSVAHRLFTAELLAAALFPILEERYNYKTFQSSGRMMAEADDGSWWRIQSGTPSAGHGLTADLLIVDELFAVAEIVIDAGLLPTQRARPNPLAVFTSTAGTEDSRALIRWRERGIQQIETGQPGRIHFAEWSPPPNIDPSDRRWWHMANPALDLGGLSMQDLEDGYNSPNREAWLRTDLNLWTAAAGSWLPHGAFEQCRTDEPMPAGGFLAVDSDSDGVGFVGVRVARRDDGHLQARSEFRVESLHAMWDAVHELLEDKAIALGLTPGLAGLCPLDLQRRMHIWGQQEMTKYTAIVRGLILEGHLLHEGQMSLEEHVNRAVSGRAAGNAITITSAKSPGPIEQCRCMIAAAGFTARPSSSVRKPMIGSAR